MNGIVNDFPAVSRDMNGTALPDYERNSGTQLFFMTLDELTEHFRKRGILREIRANRNKNL